MSNKRSRVPMFLMGATATVVASLMILGVLAWLGLLDPEGDPTLD